MTRSLISRFSLALGTVLALVATAGCTPESSITALADDTAASTDLTPIALSEAQTGMAAGGVRVEVRVRPGSPLVATELALAPARMAGEPERVEGSISATSFGGDAESVTLNIGNLAIGLDAATTYAGEDGATITADQFRARVTEALGAGRHPHIVARRPAPETPQALDNAAFTASNIKLGGSDGVLIALNAGPQSLQLNSAPPPDAFLRLLGLTIEIRISDGTTRIGKRFDNVGHRVEFHGQVKTVAVDRDAFILGSGLVVRVNDQTVIESEDGLNSLADVAEAIAAGALVDAAGAGSIASVDPRVILAAKVRFAKRRPLFEFRDLVKSVALDARTMTLANGATLCLNDQSVISQDGDLKTLQEVARALAANLTVGAAGVATPNPAATTTSPAPPCRAIVLKVRFSVVPPSPLEFRDGVKSVDVEHRRMTLASGATLCFNNESVISQDGDLVTLGEVARARNAGLIVGAAGTAAPGPYSIDCRATVLKVRFSIIPSPPPPVIEFHELVKAVDGRTIILSNDVVLCLNDRTVISQETDLKTLADVAAALAAGKVVKADGVITAASTTSDCRAIIVKVRFSVRS